MDATSAIGLEPTDRLSDRSRDHERAAAASPWRAVTGALLVAAAYYVGANLGLILRFPPTTPSVLWPPNSMLTAALLLSAPRRWWLFLLAALPAHLAAELPAGWPLSLVLALFVTNCLEAVIAASLMRRFSDDPTRFDTLRRAAVFIAAAGLVAPLVSTFADAAAVWVVLGEPYWRVWTTRLSSNVLTALTLVPALVATATSARRWIHDPLRRLEAAALAGGLFTISFLIFTDHLADATGPIPGAPVTPIVFLLPFILWATVRFGPAGTSLALLSTAVLASSAAVYGTGPFTKLQAAESVLALQMSLVVIAIPMLCLAALVEERHATVRELNNRLRFEELLSRLSGAFVHLAGHEMDPAFEHWFEQLGGFLGVDRIAVTGLPNVGQPLVTARAWTRAGGDGRRIERSLTLPLVAGNRLFGRLDLARRSPGEPWTEERLRWLRLVAEVFANALARKETDDALRASEAMKSAILGALSSSVAVLDRRGWIIAVNDVGTRFAVTAAPLGVGMNYLDHVRDRVPDPRCADDIRAGIQAVLDHARPAYAVEYVRRDDRERWFAFSVVALDRPEGGAVASETEITERKHAEREAEQSRQELAHFTRVSTMGELAASIAHELNQPLAGILLNAQTASRLLNATPVATDEVREILSDIVADDTRAAEVIRRLRDFARNSDAERVVLDLHALIRDVIRLVTSDAIIRNVTLLVDCGPEPIWVSGDRIQLQQVVLNLLLNAMEAVAESGVDDRTILVRSAKSAEAVCVAVRDAGSGIGDGAGELIFEPFYTTKPAGMGMGLSIVRSILRAHDGAISATNNPGGGSTFTFTLPLASPPASAASASSGVERTPTEGSAPRRATLRPAVVTPTERVIGPERSDRAAREALRARAAAMREAASRTQHLADRLRAAAAAAKDAVRAARGRRES